MLGSFLFDCLYSYSSISSESEGFGEENEKPGNHEGGLQSQVQYRRSQRLCIVVF